MTGHIDHLTVKNYGPLKDVSLSLTPLHAFIGPNDSGKSTLLRAVRTAVQFASSRFFTIPEQTQPFDPGLSNELPYELTIGFHGGSLAYSVTLVEGWTAEAVIHEGKPVDTLGQRSWPNLGLLGNSSGLTAEGRHVRAMLMRGARMLRLDPDALREPGKLIPKDEKARLFDERGLGLPSIYDFILNHDVDAFLNITKHLRELFPGVQSIGLENASESTKTIQVKLTSGKWVPARFVSEGILYYLAFAAIRHLEPASVLLVEEPENGLHPARIAEIMRILREISTTTQVLIATHSPLVVNELQPDEVSVVTRTPEEGTQVTRIKDTPDFDTRSKVYALGELWIAYANGKDEAPLFREPEPLDEPGEPETWQEPEQQS